MKVYNETALLKNMSITLIIIFLFFSFLITSMIINYHKKQLEREAINIKNDYINLNRELIKKEVDKIHNIIEIEYHENKTKYHLSEKQIQKDILKLISSIRYDKNGYIFVVDYNGNFLINIKQSLLSENQINLKDKNGINITKNIIEVAKKGKGYLSYIGISGTHIEQSQKISYIKSFEPWHWAIGYGFHPSDIQTTINKRILILQQENQKYLNELIFISIAITIILSSILLLFTRSVENIFIKYKNKILMIEKENRQKNEIIYHQSKMVIIGELLNMISHQWRQPLSQINSITLDMYLTQKKGSLDENNLKNKINAIENTTQYLSQTIDDFTNFFVPEMEPKLFLIKDAIEHCISIINPSINHINLQLTYDSSKYIHGYITLFQQVVLSIISNSVDIFNAKNISHPYISIKTYDKKPFTFIEISDNGGGILEKYISQVFDLYFSTKNKKNGSGLGLYIAKKILIQHFKGNIFVANFNSGVKFTIRIQSDISK